MTRCYQEGLGRNPEQAGLEYWIDLLVKKERTPSQVAFGFVFSAESFNMNLSDAEFVKMLYRLYLGREAEQNGLNHWVAKLSSGTSRQDLVSTFALSQEFSNIVKSFGLSN